jgi:hypothetical protein
MDLHQLPNELQAFNSGEDQTSFNSLLQFFEEKDPTPIDYFMYDYTAPFTPLLPAFQEQNLYTTNSKILSKLSHKSTQQQHQQPAQQPQFTVPLPQTMPYVPMGHSSFMGPLQSLKLEPEEEEEEEDFAQMLFGKSLPQIALGGKMPAGVSLSSANQQQHSFLPIEALLDTNPFLLENGNYKDQTDKDCLAMDKYDVLDTKLDGIGAEFNDEEGDRLSTKSHSLNGEMKSEDEKKVIVCDDGEDSIEKHIDFILQSCRHFHRNKNAKKDKNEKKMAKGSIRRKRKSKEQLNLLWDEYQINPNWTRKQIVALSNKTALSELQIYKWQWDQKKKKLNPSSELDIPLKIESIQEL